MLRRTSLAIGWVAAALVIAIGAAGIAAALDHLPEGSGRPELTWTADAAVEGDLDAAAADLLALAEAVGVLGDEGRTALAALVASDEGRLAAAIDAGTAQLDAIDAAAARLEARLAAIPLDAPDATVRYSPATRARHEAMAAALAAAPPLRPAWERLVAGVAPAVALTDHLLAHDEIAAEAIRLGGAGEYRDAIARIDAAGTELEAARAIRDKLAATVDVTTLDDWIGRYATYDGALRDLWDALRRSRGLSNDTVRAAAARERAALEALPPDARALVVILGDVARGGLNQAVIEIEEARGRLIDAADRVGGAATP